MWIESLLLSFPSATIVLYIVLYNGDANCSK